MKIKTLKFSKTFDLWMCQGSCAAVGCTYSTYSLDKWLIATCLIHQCLHRSDQNHSFSTFPKGGRPLQYPATQWQQVNKKHGLFWSFFIAKFIDIPTYLHNSMLQTSTCRVRHWSLLNIKDAIEAGVVSQLLHKRPRRSSSPSLVVIRSPQH